MVGGRIDHAHHEDYAQLALEAIAAVYRGTDEKHPHYCYIRSFRFTNNKWLPRSWEQYFGNKQY